jgi:hypothetical protein
MIEPIIAKMLNARSRISDFSADGAEIYFTFDKTFVFSINRGDDGEFNLYIYPGAKKQDIGGIQHAYETGDGDRIAVQRFSSKDYPATVKKNFADLFDFIYKKAMGIDEAFRHILSTPDDLDF